MKKPLTAFVVDRSTWLTGEVQSVLSPVTECVLYDKRSGMLCALGQYLHAAGMPLKALDQKFSGENLVKHAIPPEAGWILDGKGKDSALAEQITTVNDDPLLATREKERALKILFEEAGVKVQFAGRYADGIKRAKKVAGMG